MNYVDTEMPWAQWICCLATALQLDEVERYERFIMTGGKKEEWHWVFHNPYGSGDKNIAETIIAQWSSQMKATPARGSMEEAVRLGYAKPARLVDGKYVDDAGNVTDVPKGYIFVPKQ